MEKVTLNGKEYEIPTKWEEVKYSQFLSFSNLIKSFKTQDELKEELKDKGETMDLYMSLETLKSNTKMVSFWTGISEDDIAICDLDDVTLVLNKLNFICELASEIDCSMALACSIWSFTNRRERGVESVMRYCFALNVGWSCFGNRKVAVENINPMIKEAITM